MKNHISILIFSLVLIFMSGSFTQAWACSCLEQRPVCESFGDAKAVFVGEVIEGKSAERMSDIMKEGYVRSPFILKVKEAFLGTQIDKEIAINTGSGFGDCGFPFQKGETYLVYAYERQGKLTTNICTRSAHISRVEDEEFEYLRSLQNKPKGARLFGKVELYAKSSFEKNYIQPMKGIRLLIEQSNDRKRRFQVITDKFGKYELIGLNAGKYKITPFFPKDLEDNALDDEFVEFELNDKGCFKQDFFVKNRGEAFVKVIDSQGKPVQNIWVEFIPIEVQTKPLVIFDIREFGVTNPQGGRYWFNLPPGKYTVSVNYFHTPNKEHPYPATFYPNTNDRSKAQIIEIKRGSKIEKLVIQLPPSLQQKQVSGEVAWEDGSLAEDAMVYLEDDFNHNFCVDGCDNKSDSQGKFLLNGYQGQIYRVKAKVEKVIDGKTQIFEAKSEPFKLSENLENIKLMLMLNKND
ncbi:MAG TPA: hypothetical protein PKY59_25615 [Pyrinomonadaceae bacterium]|nr:hypothetical protein [Pyrinomonadaceae bacterium]